MPRRAMSICRKAGCNTLIDSPGYCEPHSIDHNPFQYQDDKKTTKSKKFYSSGAWTRTSINHRKNEPLCQECLRRGTVKAGEMVHHNPPLETLMAKGLNPLDHQYLETLCNSCHMIHLREMK